MAAGKSARKVIMKERNTTLETTGHNNRNNSENIKETPDERIPGKLIGAIVAVGSLAFIGILTETVMTVLFPQLMREFNVNTATVQWITTIYLLTVAATMPLSSYLNRKFKHRVLFLAAVALAVLGSLTMIFGHAFPVILVARIIQGIGSGVATPLMMNIILEQSPRSKVGRLMGVGSLVITVAPAIGPTVGGAVSSILPWRAIFAVISLIVGLGSLFFFGWSSRRSFSPLIRLGWLRDPMVLLHLIAYMLLPIVGIGFGYVITNLAQLSLGTNAFLAGALVLPGALIGAFFAPIGGTLYDRFGPVRPILGAFFLAICGPILLLVFSMRLTPATLAGFYFIFGLGYALGFSNIMTNALRSIAPQFMPDGNAVFNTCLQFGGAAGTALFSTVLSVAQAGAGKEGTEAFSHATAVGGSWTFTVMIVIVAVAICCLITAFRIGAKRK